VRTYSIYRRAEKNATSLLVQVPSTTRSFHVELPPDSVTAYAYGVGAQDRFGNAVMPARWVTARALRTSLPQSSQPIAVRQQGGAIAISILPLVDPDIAGQQLYRSIDGGAARSIARLDPSATTYLDHSVQPAHSYAYALAALSRSGTQGTRSAQVSLRLNPPTLSAPAISAKLLSDGTTVEIHWPQASGIVGYMLMRRGPDGATTTIAPLVRAFAYRDVLPQGAHGSFGYAVRIVTTSGVSAIGPFASISAH
jgi:hypothetical protein